MDPAIKVLAETYSVPLSDRSCYRSYLWNGKTLATKWQREVWSANYDTLESVEPPQEIEDFTMLHEIAHYVVAEEVEREFPEYGCLVLGDLNSNPDLLLEFGYGSAKYKLKTEEMEGVLTSEEQNFREACADFLAVYWCDLYGLPVKNDWRPINKYNKYPVELYEAGWRAIIWLREKGLMSNAANIVPTIEDGYVFVTMVRGGDWKEIPDHKWNTGASPPGTAGVTFLGTRIIDGSTCNIWRSAQCRWYIAQVKAGR